MRLKISFFITAILVMLLTSTRDALADHHVYWSRNPANQVGTGWPEHSSWNKWYLYSIYWPSEQIDHLRGPQWKAIETSVQTRMQAALDGWIAMEDNLNIDWHEWRDVSFQSGYAIDLEVFGSACPSGSVACLTAKVWQGASPSNGNRIKTAKLYVNALAPWDSTADHKGAYAHEIGHMYNLDERYHHTSPTTCNDSESTIMDTAFENDDDKIEICDNISAPTTTDRGRIEWQWKNGYCFSDGAHEDGNNIVSDWHDYGFEDWALRLDFYKKQNNVWVQKGEVFHIAGAGTEKLTEFRTIRDETNIQSIWGTGTYYVGCRPWFGSQDDGTPVLGQNGFGSPEVQMN